MTAGERAVAAARGALGARFRLHGRTADGGLDCVGLAAIALGVDAAPRGYALRSGDGARAAAMLRAAGLGACEAPSPGDVLMMRSGPGQLHLAVWTGDGIVHADARLGRVVERPGVPPWPVMSCWRREEA